MSHCDGFTEQFGADWCRLRRHAADVRVQGEAGKDLRENCPAPRFGDFRGRELGAGDSAAGGDAALGLAVHLAHRGVHIDRVPGRGGRSTRIPPTAQSEFVSAVELAHMTRPGITPNNQQRQNATSGEFSGGRTPLKPATPPVHQGLGLERVGTEVKLEVLSANGFAALATTYPRGSLA